MHPLILGTFVGVLVIVVGLYWGVILRSEHESIRQLRRRLKGGARSLAARRPLLAKEEQQLSQIGALNHLLVRTTGITSWLERLLEQSDSRMTVGTFVLLSVTAGVGGYSLITVFTGYRGIAAVVGAFLMSCPFFYLRWQRSKKLLKFEEGFPEAIDLISRALRAGHAFTTGLGMVAEEIPAPVGSEFKLLYDRQNFGMPLADALRAFAERIPLLDARFFATAVLTQREAGGNLSEVLENLARVVRERFKVKRQVRVISAHARMTGAVLVALPPATAAAITIVSPDNMKTLVTDPVGIKLVIAAVVMQVTGGLVVKRLTNLEY